ncbi:MAG: SagB/ThcOx family dehydrogenase [Pirellulales bacterium]
MDSAAAAFRWTELDRTRWPEFRDRLLRAPMGGPAAVSRTYPGYPTWTLPRTAPRLWCSLDRQLQRRRSARQLGPCWPSRSTLARWLHGSHSAQPGAGHGPVPSAGGLQALELYLVNWTEDWLPAGGYHFDRAAGHLSQVVEGAARTDWQKRVPSLELLTGGCGLAVIVGDAPRVLERYGPRGARFLLLEAGHLMQNLALLATSLAMTLCPLGGFFEQEVATTLRLPSTDWVLYLAAIGSGR